MWQGNCLKFLRPRLLKKQHEHPQVASATAKDGNADRPSGPVACNAFQRPLAGSCQGRGHSCSTSSRNPSAVENYSRNSNFFVPTRDRFLRIGVGQFVEASAT